MASTFIDMRDEFQQWLLNGNAKKQLPEAVLSCIDRISEYAVRKKISVCSLWEYSNHKVFNSVYHQLIETKLLRITDRDTYKKFIGAGKLYFRFLKEKPFARKEKMVISRNERTEKDEVIRLVENLGLEYVDKRNSGGALWVIGSKELNSEMISFISQFNNCLFIFDEFEKLFKRQDQELFLNFFDDKFNNNRLSLVISNDSHISEFLLDRPSRFFYKYNYNNY